MNRNGNTWVLVLAAGEGTRLHDFTRTVDGVVVPKQFCSLRGGPSLLHEALNRAHAIAPLERICTIVAAQHQPWWAPSLTALPAANVIVQRKNRGTANGILLSLLAILPRDPDARLIILPSDHHVREERTLECALLHAAEQLTRRLDDVMLLGIAPEEVDPELGYIVPGASDGWGAHYVTQFVEKPSATMARELIVRGALWNAFILAARARALLALYRRHHPQILAAMLAAMRRDRSDRDSLAVAALYECLPALDFSREVLEREAGALRVLAVPQCGWSDLGTPSRLQQALSRLPPDKPPRAVPGLETRSYVSLCAQYERLSSAPRRNTVRHAYRLSRHLPSASAEI